MSLIFTFFLKLQSKRGSERSACGDYTVPCDQPASFKWTQAWPGGQRLPILKAKLLHVQCPQAVDLDTEPLGHCLIDGCLAEQLCKPPHAAGGCGGAGQATAERIRGVAGLGPFSHPSCEVVAARRDVPEVA